MSIVEVIKIQFWEQVANRNNFILLLSYKMGTYSWLCGQGQILVTLETTLDQCSLIIELHSNNKLLTS